MSIHSVGFLVPAPKTLSGLVTSNLIAASLLNDPEKCSGRQINKAQTTLPDPSLALRHLTKSNFVVGVRMSKASRGRAD